jgi:hypothetical protein
MYDARTESLEKLIGNAKFQLISSSRFNGWLPLALELSS